MAKKLKKLNTIINEFENVVTAARALAAVQRRAGPRPRGAPSQNEIHADEIVGSRKYFHVVVLDLTEPSIEQYIYVQTGNGAGLTSDIQLKPANKTVGPAASTKIEIFRNYLNKTCPALSKGTRIPAPRVPELMSVPVTTPSRDGGILLPYPSHLKTPIPQYTFDVSSFLLPPKLNLMVSEKKKAWLHLLSAKASNLRVQKTTY
ncbi:hypothetical protein EVAR_36896_1 [Eumeta japonica]|uniref:Uncharacterized protein n=1 Tax=Eumeta variegata TaxID=151549 RepID=A0A4C1WSR4_EUMVA|nr:hypothetical protein EVAR_36896_1 [Eumeta japonica]